MKLSLFLILICTAQISASTLLGQQVSIKTEASLRTVFDELNKQTGTFFMFNEEDLNSEITVELNMKNVSLEDALDEICKQAPIKYEIVEDFVVITKKPALPKPVIPQEPKTITISGKVTDEHGEPLPFVNIYIKGDTKQGVVTNVDGKYSIQVEDKEGLTLVASFIGFVTKEFKVEGRTVINLMLSADIADLSEIVVTGYQTISSERATGSFERVKVSTVTEEKTTDNLFDLLEGEIAGLDFSDNDEGVRTVTIRGRNNFTDVSEPLIVVDGFEVVGTGDNFGSSISYLDKLNPNDIEDITVLKDAAAASIWGAKAANGVIVITTKKGKKSDTPTISYNGSYSLQRKPDYHTANTVSSSSLIDQHEMIFDIGWRAYSSPSPYYDANANPEAMEIFRKYRDAEGNLPADQQARIDELRQYDVRDEYTDLFLQNYTLERHNVSINQATDKYSFYASLGYDKTKQVSKGNENDRITTNLNFSTELNDRITFNGRVAFSKSKAENNGAPGITQIPLYQRILDEEGNYIAQPFDFHQDSKAEEIAKGIYPYDWDYNLKREFDNMDNESEQTNLDLQASLDIDLYKGLTAQLSYNYQRAQSSDRNYQNEERYYVRNLVNNSGMYSGGMLNTSLGYDGYAIPTGGILSRSNALTYTNGTRGQLNYVGYLDTDKKHHINAIAGMEYREEIRKGDKPVDYYGYNDQTLTNFPIDWQSYYTNRYGSRGRPPYYRAGNSYLENRYFSYYTNMGYTFNEKYSLTASWRLDDSNLFGSSTKYRNQPLWSVGGKWRMAQENFMSGLSFIDRLDLRVSYGIGGRIDKTSSPFLTIQIRKDTNREVANINSIENQELRWEKTSTFNYGFDFSVFNNKLSGSVEGYYRYSTDVMASEPFNSTHGITLLRRNYGEISNKGFNINLNSKLNFGEFSWLPSFNISHNINKVEKYDSERNLNTLLYGSNVEGESINYMYSYRWAGLSEVGAPQVYNVERNEDGEIIDNNVLIGTDVTIEDADALEYSGELVPKYFGSFKNSFTFKGFTVNALITYKLGHVFRRSSLFLGNFPYQKFHSLHSDFDKRWQKEGDELITDVPAMQRNMGGNYDRYYRRSSTTVENAGHIRLQSIGASYRFNPALWNNKMVKSASVGFDVQNLGCIWTANDKDIDPERGNGTWTTDNEPIYSVKFNLTF